MKITVCIRNVYGNDLIYPICKTAQLLAELAGRKTLTSADINTITSLGYVITFAPPGTHFAL